MKNYIDKFVRLNMKNSEEDALLTKKNNMKKLPDGFEFLEVKKKINIRKEKDNKEQYMDLLLEADPQKEIIEKYLKDGDYKCLLMLQIKK